MIEQTAKVLRIDNDVVVIEVKRQTACGSCSAKAGCGKSLLDNVFKVKPLLLSIANTIDAKENDEVVVGLNESAIVQASFYLYFFPLFIMIVSAMLSSFVFSDQYSEILSIIAAAFGLFFGGYLSRIILEKKERNSEDFFKPMLIRVVPKRAIIDLVVKNI